jgi:hypothetical protein
MGRIKYFLSFLSDVVTVAVVIGIRNQIYVSVMLFSSKIKKKLRKSSID